MVESVRELSLFSGAGGGLLATKHLLGWSTVAYVENNAYCQAVLTARIRDGLLDPAPIFGDIREFLRSGDCARFAGCVDVVTAGFPCQAFSTAARGRNNAKNLWAEVAETIRTVGSPFAFLENVDGIRFGDRELGNILGDLADIGYDALWDSFSAGAFGAPHRRPRVWILACNADRYRESGMSIDAEVARLPRLGWPDRPRGLRVGYGNAHRMDRFSATGNGQVSRVAALAWRELTERAGRIIGETTIW